MVWNNKETFAPTRDIVIELLWNIKVVTCHAANKWSCFTSMWDREINGEKVIKWMTIIFFFLNKKVTSNKINKKH
jgi:hypothetical protein